MLKSVYIMVVLFMMVVLPLAIMGNLLNCSAERAASAAVVTVEKRIESVALFEQLLDGAVARIKADENYDNLILFVHGRGQHPCHALEKSLIADLESDYSAKDFFLRQLSTALQLTVLRTKNGLRR